MWDIPVNPPQSPFKKGEEKLNSPSQKKKAPLFYKEGLGEI